MLNQLVQCHNCGFINEKGLSSCIKCGHSLHGIELNQDDKTELKITFKFNPLNYGNDDYQIQIDGDYILKYETAGSDYIGFLISLMLFLFLFLPFLYIFMNSLSEQNFWMIIVSGFMVIVSLIIFFYGTFTFQPVSVKKCDARLKGTLRTNFNIYKLDSLYRRKFWTYKDHYEHNDYSMYFVRKKAHLKVNNLKLVLELKKHKDPTFELVDVKKNVKFNIKIPDSELSTSKMGYFTVSTSNMVNETLILFIGYSLFRLGQLNPIIEHFKLLQTARVKLTKIKVILGLISVGISFFVPSGFFFIIPIFLNPSELASQWEYYFMIILMISLIILWSYLNYMLLKPLNILKIIFGLKKIIKSLLLNIYLDYPGL